MGAHPSMVVTTVFLSFANKFDDNMASQLVDVVVLTYAEKQGYLPQDAAGSNARFVRAEKAIELWSNLPDFSFLGTNKRHLPTTRAKLTGHIMAGIMDVEGEKQKSISQPFLETKYLSPAEESAVVKEIRASLEHLTQEEDAKRLCEAIKNRPQVSCAKILGALLRSAAHHASYWPNARHVEQLLIRNQHKEQSL